MFVVFGFGSVGGFVGFLVALGFGMIQIFLSVGVGCGSVGVCEFRIWGDFLSFWCFVCWYCCFS